jgi:hypothetical protein
VGTAKLIAMGFGTFGVYQLYWMLRQWKTIRARTGEDMIPILRAIFSLFFFHLLVREVNETARTFGRHDALAVGGLTTLFVISSLLWRLPDPWWLLSWMTFIPVVIVQRRMDELNAAASPLADRNTRIRGWNWLAMIIGIPFFALLLHTMFTEM